MTLRGPDRVESDRPQVTTRKSLPHGLADTLTSKRSLVSSATGRARGVPDRTVISGESRSFPGPPRRLTPAPRSRPWPDSTRGLRTAVNAADSSALSSCSRTSPSDAERIVASYRLHPDPDGQVMLHVVPSSVPEDLIALRGGLVPAAAAADLLDEDDPRARRSALRQLTAMLDALTDEHQLRSPARSDDAHGADHAS